MTALIRETVRRTTTATRRAVRPTAASAQLAADSKHHTSSTSRRHRQIWRAAPPSGKPSTRTHTERPPPWRTPPVRTCITLLRRWPFTSACDARDVPGRGGGGSSLASKRKPPTYRAPLPARRPLQSPPHAKHHLFPAGTTRSSLLRPRSNLHDRGSATERRRGRRPRRGCRRGPCGGGEHHAAAVLTPARIGCGVLRRRRGRGEIGEAAAVTRR